MIKELENISEENVKNKINEMINSINKLEAKKPYTGVVVNVGNEKFQTNRTMDSVLYYIDNGIIIINGHAFPIIINNLDVLMATTGEVFRPVDFIEKTKSFTHAEYREDCIYIYNSAESNLLSNKIYKVYWDMIDDCEPFIVDENDNRIYGLLSENKTLDTLNLRYVWSHFIGSDLDKKEESFSRLLKG